MTNSRHTYSTEQKQWLFINSRARKWNSVADFVNAFNTKFGLNIAPDAVWAYMSRHGMPKIDCATTDANQTLTTAQRKWIEDNLSTGVFRTKKHFVQTFNAVFGEHKSFDALSTYMQKNGLKLITKCSLPSYSSEQRDWLINHFYDYEVFADLVVEFNKVFNCSVKYSALSSYCKRNLHLNYEWVSNRGQFKPGVNYGTDECPIGTIRYNKQQNLCYIKVKMCNGTSRNTLGHNYKYPFWKRLQDKIWEDNYGVIPDGYTACALNNDPYEQDINKIGLIDKRGKCIMSRKEWWSDIPAFTSTAVQWCNLYFVAKDNGVFDEENIWN